MGLAPSPAGAGFTPGARGSRAGPSGGYEGDVPASGAAARARGRGGSAPGRAAGEGPPSSSG